MEASSDKDMDECRSCSGTVRLKEVVSGSSSDLTTLADDLQPLMEHHSVIMQVNSCKVCGAATQTPP